MATMKSYAHGQFCWVDLMAHDMAAGKEFYGKLFGWEAEDQDTQGGPPYATFHLAGQQVAGMGQMNEQMKASGTPPIWSSYVNVDDIQAATASVTDAGGMVVMPPMKVVEAGHIAIVQDPTGAMLSLWQKIQHFGAQCVNTPNSWVWNELITPEPQKAIEFFGKVFGWTFDKEPNSPNNYWMAKNGDRMNAGIMETPTEIQGVPPHWSVYFAVADIHAATNKVKELGGSVMREPFEVSVGHIGVAADAQGGAFQLIQMTVPVDA